MRFNIREVFDIYQHRVGGGSKSASAADVARLVADGWHSIKVFEALLAQPKELVDQLFKSFESISREPMDQSGFERVLRERAAFAEGPATLDAIELEAEQRT